MDWTMDTKDAFPNITKWMKNQTVFITGVSGFIGKVLLYKIFKSCSNVNDIYVLIRSKRGKTTSDRLDQLLSSEIFQEFRTKNPEVLRKVKGIEGDICAEQLGINSSDWQLLQENVTLVFHVAASVRFDDTLQKATFTNLRSTKYALLLAKGMQNLKAFVHVSTAYTNCRFGHIPENVIPTEFDPEKIITIADRTDEHKLEVLSKKLLRDYPNTYIFTKNLAEDLVYRTRFDLPVVIVRPPIVVSSTWEPKPGWCDSFSSINALVIAAGKGIYRVSYTDPKNDMDYISVDACANTMIVAAWYRNQSFSKSENLRENIVFNATDVKTKNEVMIRTFESFQYIHPLRQQLWHSFVVFTTSYWYFHLMTFLLHVLPGFILDGVLKLTGRKPMFMKIYRKIYLVSLALTPFTFNFFTFDTTNFNFLKTLVPKKERKIFFLDSLLDMNAQKFMENASITGRSSLVGDPPEIFKEDVDRVHRLYWIDRILRLTLLGIFIWILPLKSLFNWTLYKVNEYQEFLNADL